MFSVKGKPIPIPDDFALILAKIVVEWSRVESALAMDTSTMMRYVVVQELTTETPRNFKKRIELWKRSIDTLYRTVPQYRALAAEIRIKAKAAAKIRNHLMHRTWDLKGEDADGCFTVSNIRGLHIIEQYDRLKVSKQLLQDLLNDVTALSDQIFGFMTTRMLHARFGLLQAVPAPSPEHPAHPNPPTDAKP